VDHTKKLYHSNIQLSTERLKKCLKKPYLYNQRDNLLSFLKGREKEKERREEGMNKEKKKDKRA